MRNLQVTFKNKTNPHLPFTVELEGSLHEMNAINFKNDLLNIITEISSDCIVNISSLAAIDVTGLNALIMAHRGMEKAGRKLQIVSSPINPVDHFLRLSKFDKHLNVLRAS